MLRQVLRPIVRNVRKAGTHSASSELPADLRRPTINDIPVPHGSWKEHYDARQKVYNAQLIAGITVLVGTLLFVKTSDIIFFNWGPPEEPAEKK
ncbi:hypothetical protein DMN91_004816 [Ooceraea biroi]|uniref:Deltamethrin resistance protein prag01 domain-containing protein n=1 Tax=Ooceraea biroi TaxID=2015173 RepID=A0A026WZG0_OOCBI|nr:uncharacterized protein LOC105287709 [Ooceraea biroi]EZA61213.1 hypothetical protein X777_08425 [Ooceraea biroi]RLU22538.1 hypothetical protein DMN91_004816 [Ooceraea biroi]